MLKNSEDSLPKLFEILPNVLTNQNLWGCVCTPGTISSYTCQSNIMSY